MTKENKKVFSILCTWIAFASILGLFIFLQIKEIINLNNYLFIFIFFGLLFLLAMLSAYIHAEPQQNIELTSDQMNKHLVNFGSARFKRCKEIEKQLHKTGFARSRFN